MTELLHVENISKAFGGNKVLESVSFSLHQGEILGLLGQIGRAHV